MSMYTSQEKETTSPDELEVKALIKHIWDSWNRQDARAFADVFTPEGDVIGFDGSHMAGQEEIATTLQGIFTDHRTGTYIGKVRYIRFLSPDVAVLRAVVGLIPAGKSHVEPAVNSIQTLTAVRHDKLWRVAFFQNTPAQLHGRPELVQQMTEELQQLVD